jgi:hypothetical protein
MFAFAFLMQMAEMNRVNGERKYYQCMVTQKNIYVHEWG